MRPWSRAQHFSGRGLFDGNETLWTSWVVIEGGLRSHGGRYEEMVPFLISEPLRSGYAARARADVRNFDIFDFACNGVAIPA